MHSMKSIDKHNIEQYNIIFIDINCYKTQKDQMLQWHGTDHCQASDQNICFEQ
jgi:hypothetical protein